MLRVKAKPRDVAPRANSLQGSPGLAPPKATQALSWMQQRDPVSSTLLCLLEMLKKLVLQRLETWADAS